MADRNEIAEALQKEDAITLARLATKEELERLTAAELLIEKRRSRRRLGRLMLAGQALAAYVALAGFFANAYQNWADKKESHARAQQEQERWNREFKRAQDADKYRAFFESSTLVTDLNVNRHVVGYTLMKEFVDDDDYKSKAMTLLETSLTQELRDNTAKSGIDPQHKLALAAIVAAMGQTEDCRALEMAARSVDRLTYRLDRVGDAEETADVFGMYVRHVLGAAAKNCEALDDFEKVNRPIRRALIKSPSLGHVSTKLDARGGSKRLGEILRDQCEDEILVSASSDCDVVFRGYQRLCVQMQSDAQIRADQQDVCALVDQIVAALPPERAPQLTKNPQ